MMDNGASSYRRFREDGDEKGLTEIIRDYKDGLIFYLNSFVGNILIAEELAEDLLKNKRMLFNLLLTRGELFQYLAETDGQAEELFSRLVKDMTKSVGIDEKLKEENQILWVQRMNNVRGRAEEVVFDELIYR